MNGRRHEGRRDLALLLGVVIGLAPMAGEAARSSADDPRAADAAGTGGPPGAAPAESPDAGGGGGDGGGMASDSQPEYVPLLRGKSLQPGEPGYKSHAWAAAGSFGGTLLPVLLGGFLTRSRTDGVMWTGIAMIAVGQSLGPSVGYWYAKERARFTWYRLALSAVAVAAAGYPMHAYTGRLESYNGAGAATLVTIAVVAEAVTLALAAWDLSLLGETIERHNERPARSSPPGRKGTRAGMAPPYVLPLAMPGGLGVGLGGLF